MNEIVGELTTLVGGSTRTTASQTPGHDTTRRTLSRTDRLYHGIAGGKEKKAHTPSGTPAGERAVSS